MTTTKAEIKKLGEGEPMAPELVKAGERYLCSLCGALPGKPCISDRGRTREYPHKVRTTEHRGITELRERLGAAELLAREFKAVGDEAQDQADAWSGRAHTAEARVAELEGTASSERRSLQERVKDLVLAARAYIDAFHAYDVDGDNPEKAQAHMEAENHLLREMRRTP